MVQKSTVSMNVFRVFNTVFLLALMVSCLFPIINIAAISVSSNEAVMANKVSVLPIGLSFEAYIRVLGDERIWMAYRNTIVYCALSVIITHIMVTLAAYPLSKKRLMGRAGFTFFFAFTTLFSGGLIPTYMVVKSLGLVDSMWAILIPGAVSVWHLIVLRTYFQQLPQDLEEAASIDGMGSFGIMMRIYIPLSIPIYASFTLFYAVGMWNAFFNPLIYFNDQRKFPLQLILRDIIIKGSAINDDSFNFDSGYLMVNPDSIKSAVIIVIILPIISLYPFLQKYFIQGMMVGSLKG